MTSLPSTKIVPEDGSSKRLIIFIVVVLPHPDGPTSTAVSPSSMSMQRWSTATDSELGKRLTTSTRRIIGSPMGRLYPAEGGRKSWRFRQVGHR
jgi:hypothetical protein